MRWLVRLVTPPGGTVLDPFAGSGTTGIACGREGLVFIGVEREAEYAALARARITWWGARPADLPTEIILARGKERAAFDAGHGTLFDGLEDVA